jgi:hypothetical protein
MRVRLSLGAYELSLRPGESLIGRTRSCALRVDDGTVSRRHARILVVRDVCTIADLNSRNGVKVNGERITDARALADGDVVRVGSLVFTVRIQEDSNDEEIEEITRPPGEAYQVPVYRTCVRCRGMLRRSDDVCPSCQTEQPKFVPSASWSDPHGRRGAFRAPVRMRALYVSAWMTIEGEISDLSTSGAFFTSQLVDEVGTACDLLVFPADDSDVVRLSAEVARVGDGDRVGLGLRFLKMSGPTQAWLQAVSSS